MPVFATPEPISATIELNMGDARIIASDRTDTVIEVRPRDDSKESDIRAAEQTRVEYASGRLLVKTTQRSFFGRGSSVDVTIEMPAGSHVQGDSGMGDFGCEGQLGECRLKTGLGNIRLDHTGKDEERGQRGGSAKTGDVDAVWKLSVIDDMQIRVHCEIARMPVPEHDFILIREELPHLHHRIDRSSLADQFEGKVAAVMAALDMAGLDAAAGRKLARKAISTTGVTASNSMLDTACKRRQSAAVTTHWQDR